MAYLNVFVLCATMVLTHAQSCNELRKPRRTDITDKGYSHLYQGWVDVQGQGVNNDYCRVVGPSPPRRPHKWVSCALAGTQGQSQYNYQWPRSGKRVLDLGYAGTAFMMDVNGDGKADYCRCVGGPPKKWISCMLAGSSGFRSDQYGHSLWRC